VAWDPGHKKGRQVFAKGCIACPSSIQPGDRPELEKRITGKNIPPIEFPDHWDKLPEAQKQMIVAPRRALRLQQVVPKLKPTPENRVEDLSHWACAAVHSSRTC